MSDEKYDDLFLSFSQQIPQANENIQEHAVNYYSVPPMSDDQLRLWLHNAPFVLDFPMEDHPQPQDHRHPPHRQSSSEISSSRKMVTSENSPPVDDVNSNQSSEEKGKHVDIQTNEKDGRTKNKEVGEREDTNDCKQGRRKRPNEVQNLNEKLRRQKFAKKLKALQDAIPNSSKRDKSSTIDEAIEYIRALQYQLQMRSIGAGYAMFHSPPLMMPHPGHQAVQIPSLPPFLQVAAPTNVGMTYGVETGVSGMYSPINFPVTQFGLPNPCLIPPSSSSGATNSIQNGGK